MTDEADRLARMLDAIAGDIERILPLSRTQPHIFAEQKDELARRSRKLACEVRNTFGGAPSMTKTRPAPFGRHLPSGVRCEVRRRSDVAVAKHRQRTGAA